MIRYFSKFMLASLCGLTLPALPVLAQSAAAPAKAPAAPVLTDAEVPRYLTFAQHIQWDAAQKQVTDGQSMIDNGNWLLGRTQAKDDTVDSGIKEAHAAGQTQVTDGTAMLAQGQQALDALRQIAQKASVVAQAVAAAGKLQLVLPVAQWPDVYQRMSGDLMKSLWAAGYTQIYLDDVYSFEKTQYVSKPALTEQVREALVLADGNRSTLVPQAAASIKVTHLGDNLVIDFPDRSSTTQSQSAVVVGEMIETANGYAYFSLRAVDLASGKILHNELALLSVEPTLGKALGLVAYQVPAERVVPAATPVVPAGPATPAVNPLVPAAPAPAVADTGSATITLLDNNGILATFKAAPHPYTFRADSDGTNNTLENRLALLFLKSLLTEKSSLTVTDYDFLAEALPADNPADRLASPAGVNASWTLTNAHDLNSPTTVLMLKARNLASSNEVSVGKFVIATALKPLTPPSPDQLMAAGYQLMPATPPDQSQNMATPATTPATPATSTPTAPSTAPTSPAAPASSSTTTVFR
jgi:hypothetical protein